MAKEAQSVPDQLRTLNESFLKWLTDQIPKHKEDSFADACQDYIDYCGRLGVKRKSDCTPEAESSPIPTKPADAPAPGPANKPAPTNVFKFPAATGPASMSASAPGFNFPAAAGLSSTSASALSFNLPAAAGSTTSGFDFSSNQMKPGAFSSMSTFSTGLGAPLGGTFGAGTSLFGASSAANSVLASGGFSFTPKPLSSTSANESNGDDAAEEPDASQPQEPQVQVAGEDEVLLKMTATLYIMEDGKWNGSGTGVLTLRKPKGSQKPYVRMTTETGRVTLNATLLAGQPPKPMPKQPLRCMLSVVQDGAAKPVLFAFKTMDAISEFTRCMSQYT